MQNYPGRGIFVEPMPFPKLTDKHLFESLLNPEDFTKYRKWTGKNFPSKIIITYQKKPLTYFRQKFRGRYRSFKFTGNHRLLIVGDLGFIKMTGIGAPHAVFTLERLIALGGKEFINMGSAGGLITDGIFLCTKAVRDEGTSHHYLPDGIYAYPDKKLTDKLGQSLIKRGFSFSRGSSWTIDAPYRETNREVKHYQKNKVMTVEMEASALFAVEKLRKVKIASVFVVSDVLGNDKWEPQYHDLGYKERLNQMVDVAIDCLTN